MLRKYAVPKFLNYYQCPECNVRWEDVWDCMVDDECPACGERDISPYESKKLVEDNNQTTH